MSTSKLYIRYVHRGTKRPKQKQKLSVMTSVRRGGELRRCGIAGTGYSVYFIHILHKQPVPKIGQM
jgi:hypothetical protein